MHSLILAALRTLALGLIVLALPLQAASEPQVRVGMLQFGTAHWELEQIRRQGLDREQGYRLVLQPLANNAAGLLALTSGSVDLIVSDWIWAAQRTLDGAALRFIPFSSSIGELVVPADSTIHSVADLRGKRLGVAGGPQGKSWRLLDAYARQQGIELQQVAAVSFAAPPLLSRELEAGRLDAILTFWHFAARLHARGFRAAFGAAELAQGLGLPKAMPMLGYVARDAWIEANAEAVRAFARSVVQAKRQLREDAPWQALRPLLRAADDAEFDALRQGYRQGEPDAQIDAQAQLAAQRVWQQLGIDSAGRALPLSIFRALDGAATE